MSIRGTMVKTVSGFGNTMSESANRDADSSGLVNTTVLKGKASTAFTKLTSSTGTVTLAAGHGLTSGTYDVYWSGGSRRNVTVVVTTNSLALSGGAGTNLPANDITVIVSPQETFSAGIGAMANVQMVGRKLQYSGTAPSLNAILQLLDVGHSYATNLSLEPNASVIHDIEGGDDTDLVAASYLTGVVSNPSSTSDAVFSLSWLTE